MKLLVLEHTLSSMASIIKEKAGIPAGTSLSWVQGFIDAIDSIVGEDMIQQLLEGTLTVVSSAGVITIAQSAFMDQSMMTEVSFPNCTTIGSCAFMNVSTLSKATFGSTVPTLGTSAFDGTAIASGTGMICVPLSMVDTYKAATGWSAYSNYISGI